MNTVGIETARALRTALAALALVLLVPLLHPAASAAAPVGPGSLISATPFTVHAAPGVPLPGVRAYALRYRSTDVHGQAVEVTGSLLVPTTRAPRALVGFAVGTQGLADRCAASRQLAAGTEYEVPQIEPLLSRGWAVAVTDYPGLGTSAEHPYVVGPALAHAVLDSMRASRQVSGSGVSAALPTAVEGYSEGGGAAGWTAQLAPTYAPDLHVRAVAAGGVVADLPATYQYVDGGPVGFLTLYTIAGLMAAYPERHWENYLTPQGRDIVAALRDSCITDAAGDYPPFTRAATYSTRPLAEVPGLEQTLERLSLGATAPTMPVLLQHSPTDEVLPYAATVALRDTWRREGAHVEFLTQAGDHVVAGGLAAAPAAAFLARYLPG